MANTIIKPKSPLDYYTENLSNYNSQQNQLLASKYGANYQNNPNFNANQGMVQTNMSANPNYTPNAYQQQIDLLNYKNSQSNQAITQSALDLYKQTVNQNYSAKQEAEVQKELAQMYTSQQLQNQGLGNQGIVESTRAKLYNNYANQVGNANAVLNQNSNAIMSQYQQAINQNNTNNMDLNYELQNEMYTENANKYLTDLSKYVAYDNVGNITSNSFNSLDEIDNLYNSYKGQLGGNEQQIAKDIESLKVDYLTRNYGVNLNSPLDLDTLIVQYAQKNKVNNGDVFKISNKNYIYYNGKMYLASKYPKNAKVVDFNRELLAKNTSKASGSSGGR